MATRTATLYANRGDDSTFNIFVVAPGTSSSYVDLNKLISAKFTVREYLTAPTIVFEKTLGNGIDVPSPGTGGLLLVVVSSDDLPDINRTRRLFVYDLEVDVDGIGVFTAQRGTLEVSGTVSRVDDNVVLNAPKTPSLKKSEVLGLPPDGVQGDLLFKVTSAPGVSEWRSADSLFSGISWLTGNGPPSEASGSNGDLYYDSANIAIYGPKFEGQWGLPVNLVPDENALVPLGGAQGQALVKLTSADRDTGWGTVSGGGGGSGNTILSGDGSPSDALGEDGDFYFDTTNSAYYGPKVAGSWGNAVSLIGPQGNPGSPGIDGADGSSVLSGVGVPSNVLGENGDFYIDTNTTSIYGPKVGGVWGASTSLIGADGADGANGANGADGRTILNGVGVPGSGLGLDGDFYIDTDGNNLYGPKAGGEWGAPTSLVGADGADGTSGVDGNTVLSGTGAPDGGTGVDGDFYIDTTGDDIYGPKAGGVWGAATSLVGPAGADGAGVPLGGSVGQYLRKQSGTDLDTAFFTIPISDVDTLQTSLDNKVNLGDATGQFVFASRAAAEAAIVSTIPDNILVYHDGRVLSYVRDAGATALTTGDGATWAPSGRPSGAHYGALNDSSFDSTPAFNAAIASHNEVFVHETPDNGNVGGAPGYRLDNPILMREGVTFYGAGPNQSWIRANTALGDQPMIARPDWDSVTSDTDAGVGNITIRGIQIRDNPSISRTNTWTIDLTNSNANRFENIHLVGNADPVAGAQLHGIAVGRRWDSAFSASSAWVHVFDNVELTGAKLLINGSDSNIQNCKLFSFGKDYCVRIGASQVDILGTTVTGGSVEGGIFISGDSQAGTIRHITVNSTFMDGGSVNDRVSLRHIYAPSTQRIEGCQFIQNDGFNHGREVIRLENAHRCTVTGNEGREADNYDAGLPDLYVKGTHNVVFSNHFERGSTCFKSGTFGTVEARANLGRSIQVIDDDGASGTSRVFANNFTGAGYATAVATDEFNIKRIGPIGSGATDGSATWLMEMLAEALRITAPGTDRLELDGRIVVAAAAAQLTTAVAATSDEALVLHNQGSNHIALTGGGDDWGINVDGSGNLRLVRRSGTGAVDIGNVGVSPGGSIEVQGNTVIDPQRGVRLRSYTAAELDDVGNVVNTTNKAVGKVVWDSTNECPAWATSSSAASSWIRDKIELTQAEFDALTPVSGQTYHIIN